MKKLISLVLTLALVLMACGSVFADTPSYETPLTVTGLETGDVAHFYQVIEWVGETTDHSDVTGWKAVAPFDTYLTKTKLTEILLGTADDPATTDVNEYVAKTGITSTVAGELASLASGDGTAVTEVSGTATFNNPEAGMWMAIITPANPNTVYNPLFVSGDYLAGGGTVAPLTYQDAVAKKSTLTLTKTADNESDYNRDHADTTAIGDTITFTVNTTIPAYGDVYEHPHFAVKDTLTDLTLNADSVTVTVPSGLTKGTEYSVSATTAGYTLTFSEAYLKTIKTNTNVTITYTAVVATTAVQFINEEDNDVMIEYSHNPNDESDYDVKKDTTQHYTFTIDANGLTGGSELFGKKSSEIVKIGLDGAGNPITQTTLHSEITGSNTWTGPLQGAQFGLWKNAQCTGDAYKTQITGEDGRMTFAGLDAGTYYLKEISAPDGYVTNTTIHTVVLAAELESITVTEYYDPSNGQWYSTDASGRKAATYETKILKSYSVTIDGTAAATYTFTNVKDTNSNEIQWTVCEPEELPCQLTNIKGVELPSTGGIGTTIFYIVGGLLLVGAAVILVARKKAEN